MLKRKNDYNTNFSHIIRTKAGGLLKNSRPILLSKTLLIMLFGAYLASDGFPRPVETLLYSFLVVGPLLWSGLYSIGNYFDAEIDKLDPRKANRPLVDGSLSNASVIFLSMLLITVGLILSYVIDVRLFYICLLMTVSQFLYSYPKIRLKAVIFGDLLLVGIVNPTLRFLAGWILFSKSLAIPLLPLVFLWLFHVSGVLTRGLLNRDYEQRMGFNSTSAVLSQNILSILATLSLATSLVIFITMCLSGIYNFGNITSITPLFLPLVVFPIIGIRDFLNILKHPEPKMLDRLRAKGWLFVALALLYTLLLLLFRAII